MGIKYLEGFKERCPTLLVSEQEPEICSLSRSGNTERSDSASISSTTRREITSTSSLTVQSTEVCPTSSTTERPAESSTLPPTPSVSSATSASTPVSSQRESTSESSTSASVSQERLSLTDAETTKPRSLESAFKSRESHSSSVARPSSTPRLAVLNT